ncbi:MAG TPA: M20/M25/M40 family metallo-hydrolase [Candidatus Acidoferrales bacterium]|jgi:acetylornithine deacetylase/succinyl-diaminopimelate desuccinylase-like protein|nr:M20/M25/M40 family metallo-hydrolase [Candidatus Acidoferrales bacterium]
MRTLGFVRTLRAGLLVCAAAIVLPGARPLRGADSAAGIPEVARLLTEVISIDTSNPPGNEGKLAEFLKTRFAPLGFEIDIIPTPQPGKAHFIARLRGDGSKRPVLIAAHEDVVGVEREKWSLDPFAGVIKDGYVYGRGAIDFKGGLAIFAQAVLDIARQKRPLARDIIFLAEADEEGGAYGTRFLAENAWEKIDCEFALNEGGWIIQDAAGKVQYVSISTADKSAVSLLLTARGTSTHSSMPRPDNAIFTLARALAKLSEYDTKPKLTDSTREFFLTLSETSTEPMKTHFRNLATSHDPKLVAAADRAISENPLLHAIMRNTIAPVLLNAGFRGNVIPGSAEATINFRTIPGTTQEELIEEIRHVINDPRVDVTPAPTAMARGPVSPDLQKALDARAQLMRGVKESPKSGALYDALVKQAKLAYPGARVTPYLFQAGTDAYAWRSRGVPVYGIYPYPISAQDLERMHGNDERVPIASLESGLQMITNTLLEVAAK